MTSLSTVRTDTPSLEGRSVRDIVETTPELVNEVWCRKIFRQILQSLELQYAMHMPHRAITPDTIVFHENGEPLLVPAVVGEPLHSESEDLAALAGIVHFAITHELMPTGPLRGRALEGYSDSLISAVDRCMAPDPAQRPRSIDELRDILGIVTLGPPVAQPAALREPVRTAPAAAAPTVPTAAAFAASPAMPAAAGGDALPSFLHGGDARVRSAGLGRWQRWAIAAGGGAVLVALAVTMFAELRDSGSYDHIVLTLPQKGDGPKGDGQTGDGPRDTDAALADARARARAQAPGAAGVGASGGGALAASGPDGAAATQAGLDPNAAPMAPGGPGVQNGMPTQGQPAGAHAPVVPKGGASYRLRIQPWGVVYVDGVDSGVSPPVKRLVLAPGRHTLRVTNPAFQDRVLDVDTAAGDGMVAVDFSNESQ